MTVGFEVEDDVFTLAFTDPKWTGLEVRARGADMRTVLGLVGLMNAEFSEQLARTSEMVEVFASVLESWNVTRKGVPVPATKDGLLSQKPQFVIAVVTAWMDAVMGVSGPLDDGSSPGDGLMEATLPMSPLSTLTPV